MSTCTRSIRGGGYKSRRQSGGNCLTGAVGFGTSFANMPISKFPPYNSYDADPNYYNLNSRNIPMTGGSKSARRRLGKQISRTPVKSYTKIRSLYPKTRRTTRRSYTRRSYSSSRNSKNL